MGVYARFEQDFFYFSEYMKVQRTYDVGPVDLYDLSFSVSIGDLKPDFRLSEAYYRAGHIEACWIDGLGRKSRIPPVSIKEDGLASIFKDEELQKANSIFSCRNEHQKSLATWIFVSWKGDISYLVVRENEHYKLELLSVNSGITDLSFSNIDDLLDKLTNHYIIKSVPSVIIKDLLSFVKDMFGIEKEISKLQLNDEVILLCRDHEVIQINSFEKSGSAYIHRWELPVYGNFKVPRIMQEKMEFERLGDRIAYYRSSGYSELPPIIRRS